MTNIGAMWLRFSKLQESDLEAKKLRSIDLPEGSKDMKNVFQY